jgi:hypothetical protein
MAKASEWAARVAEWRASGVSAREFCVDRGYAPSSLLGWSSRLQREKGRKHEAVAPRVPLARVLGRAPAVESRSAIMLEVGGARMEVRAGTDRATLSMVLEALRAVTVTGSAP